MARTLTNCFLIGNLSMDMVKTNRSEVMKCLTLGPCGVVCRSRCPNHYYLPLASPGCSSHSKHPFDSTYQTGPGGWGLETGKSPGLRGPKIRSAVEDYTDRQPLVSTKTHVSTYLHTHVHLPSSTSRKRLHGDRLQQMITQYTF